MGALTSKVYSFSLRPWELKVIETFDFIDSWVSSIFLNTRGSKIIRILPRVTTLCTETFWISDKTRFFSTL
jgi:NADH dehydrogenase/NADH:ubiquinone oxidoreductase subunit G